MVERNKMKVSFQMPHSAKRKIEIIKLRLKIIQLQLLVQFFEILNLKLKVYHAYYCFYLFHNRNNR